MSMMGQRYLPSACETDVTGAVSMAGLLLAGGSVPALLDWNNNFGREADKCVCTHCSNYPKSFMGNEVEISKLDVLGTVIERQRCFGAVKGKVAPGPMTYFRISTDDTKGRIKSYLGEGQFTNDPYGMDGGIAVCQVKNLRALLGYICQNGFEHHVAMARTHCAAVLQEAVCKYLGWDLYYHR
jgi:L-fucose isomerase-like protein